VTLPGVSRSDVPQNAAKTKKDLLNHEPSNTSNPNHRRHPERIDAERRTPKNGSQLPAPSKSGLCAMEGGTESKETIRWKDKERIWRTVADLRSTIFRCSPFQLSCALEVNDFHSVNPVYQVNIQGENAFGLEPESIPKALYPESAQRNVAAEHVAQCHRDQRTQQSDALQSLPSADINAVPQPGLSSGQALYLMEQMATESLPQQFGYEWSERRYNSNWPATQRSTFFPCAGAVRKLDAAGCHHPDRADCL
jgi:hypothetical protein